MTLQKLITDIKTIELDEDNRFQSEFQKLLKSDEKEALQIIMSIIANSKFNGVATIDKFYEKVFNEYEKEVGQHLRKRHIDSFLRYAFFCQLLNGTFRKVDIPGMPDLKWHYDNGNYKTSLKAMRDRLIHNTDTDIKRAIISNSKGSFSFKGIETGTKKLIDTESTYVERQSHRQAAEEEGFDRYIYIATLDNLTCENCRALDEKVFYYKDAEAGVNFPPMHPWCRCVDCPYNPKWRGRRTARDVLNQPIEVRMDYDEWLKKYAVDRQR